jgi:hypothetical protein
VAMMLLNIEVDDYDAWKPMFDKDPAGRRQSGATSHMVSRAADNPNDVFIRVEFPSVDQRAKRGDPGADEKVANRACSDTGSVHSGGVTCQSLVFCRPTRTTRASFRS